MIHAVILAGGRGTRFWPLSRRKKPKQLLKLGSSNMSMLEDAISRAASFTDRERIHLCTHSGLLDQLDFPVGNLEREQLILEPRQRDTAAALALSSLYLRKRDPEAVMVSLNSDHQIRDMTGFHRTIRSAADLASDGKNIIIGAKPTRPETGYGYLHLGEKMGGSFYKLLRFKEKPTRRTALRYMNSGQHLWNTGIFTWRCDKFMEELRKHMPVLYREVSTIGQSIGTDEEWGAKVRAYSRIDSISIDYGLFEKAKGLVALKAGFDWEDLGSWTSLEKVKKPDQDGNVVEGSKKVLLVDSKDCIAVTGGPLIGLIGMKDVIAVTTGDAVLVVHKSKAQNVKDLVAEIERRGLDEYL